MFKENPDFYPTPESLIRKMTNKIDWKYITSVLEPSAGKGDLVEAIYNQFQYTQRYRSSKFDIDTIEYDENLRHILKGKDYRVVADDFIAFDTYKKYDLILMNPPYSAGDKHLLKAISLVESQHKKGQIVCLLNSETLKNPYTNTRKTLVRKLEEYNAEIEYIEKAFVDSERSTEVETALVYISIEKTDYKSILIDELRKDDSHKINNNYTSTQIINADLIKGIVEQFNYEVKAGLKLIDEFNSLKPLMLRTFKEDSNPVLKLELEYKDDTTSLENAYIKQIRAKYWSTLFSNDQFMGLFTSNLKQKYMQHVEELKDYDFSLYNIYTLRIQLSKEMTQGVEDTILNLFEEFSHKHYFDESSKNIHLYNGWKTNKSWKVNKKVIIPLQAYRDIQYSWGGYKPTYYDVLDKLKDIEKVFNYLSSGDRGNIDILESLKMSEHNGKTKKIELNYFYITFYKKGTCHIEFKNTDLLHKFNLFGSQKKGWLPPSYGKVRYNEMTQEEKDVVNDFEGQSSYNKVMSNKSYFFMDTREILKLTS